MNNKNSKIILILSLISLSMIANENNNQTETKEDISSNQEQKMNLIDFLKLLQENQNNNPDEDASDDTPNDDILHSDFFKPNIKKSEEKFISPYSNLSLEDMPSLDNIFKKGIPYELTVTIERLKAKDLKNRKHGLIFYGPPGTGKTTTAELIARACNRKVVFCNGSDFINKYQGSGSEGIQGLFNYAKSLNQPVIIVIDEIDAAAAKKKDTADNVAVSNTANDMTTQLINQMNLIENDPNIFVIGTTNHEDIIEGAIKSRFDFIKIRKPSAEQRFEMIKKHLEKNNFKVNKFDPKTRAITFISKSTIEDLASYCDGWDCRNVITAVTNAVDAYKYKISMKVNRNILRKITYIPVNLKMKNKSNIEKYLYKSFEDQEDKLLGEKSFYSISNFKKEIKKTFVPSTVNYLIMSGLYFAATPIKNLATKGRFNLCKKFPFLDQIMELFIEEKQMIFKNEKDLKDADKEEKCEHNHNRHNNEIIETESDNENSDNENIDQLQPLLSND